MSVWFVRFVLRILKFFCYFFHGLIFNFFLYFISNRGLG